MFARVLLLLAGIGLATLCQAAADPLPAWRDGPGKQRILDFVRDVSTPGSSGDVARERSRLPGGDAEIDRDDDAARRTLPHDVWLLVGFG